MGRFASAARELRGYRFEVASARSPAYWIEKLFGGGDQTASGNRVNPDNALQIVAVYSAVKIISEDVAGLPFNLYRVNPDGTRSIDRMHPLYRVLHDRPNPEMSAFDFKQTLTSHVLLRGNGFAQIIWDNGGRPIELWPLNPARMTKIRAPANLPDVPFDYAPDDVLFKYVKPDSTVQYFPQAQIFHLRGLGPDGLTGWSPIRMAREAIGTMMAAEEYAARFWANDATPGTVIKHPKTLSDTAFRHLEEDWEERHKGTGNASRVGILEEGMDILRVGVPPEDAQFLGTREWGVTEIARLYRLAPHKLQDLSHATFSNIEELNISHAVDTISPWTNRWESQVAAQLTDPTHYMRANLDALQRGNTQARYEAYAKGFQNGFLNPDSILAMENREPIEGGRGEEYYVPLNLIPASARDENGMTMQEKLEVVAKLVKAGFEPAAALAALQLPEIDHTGVVPGTPLTPEEVPA